MTRWQADEIWRDPPDTTTGSMQQYYTLTTTQTDARIHGLLCVAHSFGLFIPVGGLGYEPVDNIKRPLQKILKECKNPPEQ